jgi:hypothetical protein
MKAAEKMGRTDEVKEVIMKIGDEDKSPKMVVKRMLGGRITVP